MRTGRFASILTASVLLVLAGLQAQTLPLEGTWRVNLEKSKFSPGPAPKSQTLRWERVQGGWRFTVDQVNAKGVASKAETMEKDDGSEAPVKSTTDSPNKTTRYLKRIDDRTYEDGDRVNGKPTITRRLVISPDGKTLTITMKGTNLEGQTVNNVVVYEKS